MEIRIFNDYDELSRETAKFISEYIKRKDDSLLCFPAGDSPAGTFRYLIEAAREGTVDFDNVRFVGLDEWVGLSRKDEGSCTNFMFDNLFVPLHIDPSRIQFFDACAADLSAECGRIDRYIFNQGAINLMLVGVGMNGHIGLNEPGVSPELYSHLVDLDPVTKTVGQKYFKRPTPLEKGITLGMKHLMEADMAILIVSGSKKAEIAKKLVEIDPSPAVPASLVKNHKNAYLFLDKAAAALL